MNRTGRGRTRIAVGVCALVVFASTFATVGNAGAQTVLTVAIGTGTVPDGEFAGRRIRAVVVGVYSGIGLGTLETGYATVWIGTRRFDAIVDPAIESFCCGGGHVGTDFFSITGWIRDNAPGGPHAHLFGTSATTDGRMCVNIVDQTNSVVPPATPPHDPGIGLICDLPALVAVVPLGPTALVSTSLAPATLAHAPATPTRGAPGVVGTRHAALRRLG
jgi:hypothetical protein